MPQDTRQAERLRKMRETANGINAALWGERYKPPPRAAYVPTREDTRRRLEHHRLLLRTHRGKMTDEAIKLLEDSIKHDERTLDKQQGRQDFRQYETATSMRDLEKR